VNLSHRLRFYPPAHQFDLCTYKVQRAGIKLPVRGFFQLKLLGTEAAQLLIQLKLDESMPTTFAHCEARIPCVT